MKDLNNAEADKRLCHSHDFCDANATMLSAFKKCFPETEFNFDNENHIDLFNKAWSLAKSEGQI